MKQLRDFTAARVALGRTGNSVPTRGILNFNLAHARARDAVHLPLDVAGFDATVLDTRARDRTEYLRRPDLGRQLDEASKTKLKTISGPFDIVFAIVDGLSAQAVHNHALPVLNEMMPMLAGDWKTAPLILVRQGRVAIADEIGSAINAALSVVLIGERPGLSSADSLGIYLTWNPHPGRLDSDRNCISNIHAGGMSHGAAALLLAALMRESRLRKLSGIALKAPGLNSLPEAPSGPHSLPGSDDL
jgi:ethanolamine ammonia-lyase small subunit